LRREECPRIGQNEQLPEAIQAKALWRGIVEETSLSLEGQRPATDCRKAAGSINAPLSLLPLIPIAKPNQRPKGKRNQFIQCLWARLQGKSGQGKAQTEDILHSGLPDSVRKAVSLHLS
jgi:hypothetical protein